MYATIKSTLARILPSYDPGVKVGEVKAPYCVVHDMGVKPQEGTGGKMGQQIYEIVILTPISAQELLPNLCRQVREALAAIPRLRYTGEAAPTGLEDRYLGAAQSLIYRLPVINI